MLEFQTCIEAPGSSLTFSTVIPMTFVGMALRRVKPFSGLSIRAYFGVLLLVFVVWAAVAVQSICQSGLSGLNGLTLVLLNSLPALLAPYIAFRSEFKAKR
jgi:hypothetical protein